MLILLPREKDGLASLETNLTPERLHTLLGSLREETVGVKLPRFTFSWGTIDLVAPLQALGMKEAFTGKADFSGMDGSRGFFISLVLHKAFIEVNEQGSEAAAATAVTMKRSMPRLISADHPFLFLIRDNVFGSILFLGRVADPQAAG
jgi:serpin B